MLLIITSICIYFLLIKNIFCQHPTPATPGCTGCNPDATVNQGSKTMGYGHGRKIRSVPETSHPWRSSSTVSIYTRAVTEFKAYLSWKRQHAGLELKSDQRTEIHKQGAVELGYTIGHCSHHNTAVVTVWTHWRPTAWREFFNNYLQWLIIIYSIKVCIT